MLARALFVISTAVSAVGLASCKSAVDHGAGRPGLTIVSGNAQTSFAGETLASPLVVRLGDASGQPAGGATIGWQVLGGGSGSASSSVTDAEGLASITLTLGVVEGVAQEVRARMLLPGPHSSSPPSDVTFAATITPTANAATALTWTAEQLPTIPSCAAQWSDIWAASATDVFAVGGCGAIRHFSGASWEAQSSGTNHTLAAVWGKSSTDVSAVGDSATVLHYDGATWSEVPGLPLGWVNAVWGSQTGDLFVVTRDSVVKGHVWRHNDARWTVQFNRMCAMSAIWGSSSSDIFAVGVGLPVRYDGTSWTGGAGGGCTPLAGFYDVAGGGPGELYAVGAEIDYSNSTRGGAAANPAVVVQYDGTYWQRRLTLQQHLFLGVWVGSDSEVVVVGWSGLIIHGDGTHWRLEPSGTSATIIAVTGKIGRAHV